MPSREQRMEALLRDAELYIHELCIRVGGSSPKHTDWFVRIRALLDEPQGEPVACVECGRGLLNMDLECGVCSKCQDVSYSDASAPDVSDEPQGRFVDGGSIKYRWTDEGVELVEVRAPEPQGEPEYVWRVVEAWRDYDQTVTLFGEEDAARWHLDHPGARRTGYGLHRAQLGPWDAVSDE